MRQQPKSNVYDTVCRIRALIHEVGPAYAAQQLIERIVPAWIFRCNVLVVVVAELGPRSEVPVRDPAVRWGSEVDLPEIAKLGFSSEICRSWLNVGGRFAVLESDGHIVGCSWFQNRMQDVDGWLLLVCPETGTWSRGTQISRQFRGQGAFPRILAFVYSDLRRAGCRHVLAAVDALNRNSLRAGEKTGTRPLLRIYYLRLLGLTVVFVRGKLRVGTCGTHRSFEIDIGPFLQSEFICKS